MKHWHIVVPMLVVPLLAACAALDKVTGGGGTCAGPIAYAAGTTASGVTGVNDCKGPDGTMGQLYTMTVSQPGGMSLSVTPSGFPAHLALYTSSGDLVGQTNEAKLLAFLPAGSFQVFVSSTSGKDGSFTLSSPAASLSGCTSTVPGVAARGATLSGTLDASDCGNSLSKGEAYDVYLKAGNTVSVTFTVDRVAGLFVLGDSRTLASREMSASGTWTTSITAATAGYYGVRIESRTTSNGSSNLPVAYTIALD